MICAVCDKCGLASCRYKWYGNYVMNGKRYEQLEFKCSKCGQYLFKHITTEEYEEDIKNKYGELDGYSKYIERQIKECKEMEDREIKLQKIMRRLNYLVSKDMNGEPITDEELSEYKLLEEELKLIGFEHLGNGLIAEIE